MRKYIYMCVTYLNCHQPLVAFLIDLCAYECYQGPSHVSQSWIVSEEEKKAYDGFFQGADKDGDGLVNGK